MSIKAIFYSKFDTQEGPKVIHQVPEGSIVPSTDSNDGPPFFSFPSISSFIIPRQSLCGNLISLVPPPYQSPPHTTATTTTTTNQPTPSYRILGHPVRLESPTYSRNEFIFNFCLVLSAADPDFNAYKSVVTKLAHLMLSLEEQSHFLSRDTSLPNTGKLYSLCETLISDLNNYCECMIPIDNLNTLNLKLFPTYSPPPPVKAWHVPIFTVRPESLMDENWDLTMQRIIPHINGISSVKHISILADADLSLTKQCIKHLLYYGCVLLLDIFSFNAIYAPTAEFATSIAADEDMQRECARYVNTAFAPTTTWDKLNNAITTTTATTTTTAAVQPDISAVSDDDIWPLTSTGKPVDGVGIVELFAALKQGQSVREWYAENSDMLANIDLRRFITFGIIKGFVYRVHKYAFAVNQGAAAAAAALAGGRSSSGRMISDGKGKGEGRNGRTTTSNLREGKTSRMAAVSNGSNFLHLPSRRPPTQAKEIAATATARSTITRRRGSEKETENDKGEEDDVSYDDDDGTSTPIIHATNHPKPINLPHHHHHHHQHSHPHPKKPKPKPPHHRHRRRRRQDPPCNEHETHHHTSSTSLSFSSSSSSSSSSSTNSDTLTKEDEIEEEGTNRSLAVDLKSQTSRLARYLDGTHPFDQICTEMEIGEGELEGWLRAWGWGRGETGGERDGRDGVGGKGGEVLIIHR